MRFFSALLVLAFAASAQQAQFAAPPSGLVFDGISRSLRQVIGSPGAAYLGSTLVADIDSASVSPDGHKAIVKQGDLLHFIPRLEQPSTKTIFDPGPGGSSEFLWASDSQSGALLDAGRRSLTFFRVEQDKLKLDSLIVVGNDARLLAISGRGNQVLIRRQSQDRAELLLIDGPQAPTSLGIFPDPVAATFDSHQARVFVLDRANSEILAFPLSGTTSPTVLLNGENGISDPVGFTFLNQNEVLIASASRRRLTRHSLDGKVLLGEWDLDTEPSSLSPVPGTRFFAFGSLQRPGDTLFAAVTDPETRIFFIAPQD